MIVTIVDKSRLYNDFRTAPPISFLNKYSLYNDYGIQPRSLRLQGSFSKQPPRRSNTLSAFLLRFSNISFIAKRFFSVLHNFTRHLTRDIYRRAVLPFIIFSTWEKGKKVLWGHGKKKLWDPRIKRMILTSRKLWKIHFSCFLALLQSARKLAFQLVTVCKTWM